MKTLLTTMIFLAAAGTMAAQTADISAAKVQRINGLYVFTDCLPVAQYDYLGTVEIKRLGGFQSPQYTVVRDELLKRVKEEYPNANGAIMYLVNGAKDKADAVLIK